MPEAILEEPQTDVAEKAPPTVPTRTYFQQNPKARWLILLAAVIALSTIVGLWIYYSGRESTDDAQIDGDIIPISARVGGTVTAVNVVDNQYVEAGTVLAQIDPADYRVALERAQADLADAQATAEAAGTGVPITSTTSGSELSTAEAKVRSAQAGVTAAEKELGAARAKLNSEQAKLSESEANQTKAGRDLDRMKQLVDKDEISRQQYDAVVAAAASAQAVVESSRAVVQEAAQGVQVSASQLNQARAQLAEANAEARSKQTAPEQIKVKQDQAASAEAKAQQAKAGVDQAQLNLQYTTIKAPLSGIISKKSVEPGQVIQSGQPLLAIVPLEDLWVTANFKETQLDHMRPGQRATITVDAFGGRKFKGHVESISAATGARFSLLPPENAAGNYVKVVQRVPVKILIDKGEDPEHLLRPGMSAFPIVYIK